MTPAAGDPVNTARAFIHAVAWGEHHTVWDLLGKDGRRAVLRVATARGMDDALAARIRDGTASAAERDAFLTDLVNGLRADLVGTDLDALDYVGDPAPEPDRARVILAVPFPDLLDQGDGVPVGSIELADEDGRWLVERLVPRPGIGPGFV